MRARPRKTRDVKFEISRALRGNVLGWYPHRSGMGMGWDGMETYIPFPPPVTIPSPSPNLLIPGPYHAISRNCSHPTQNTMIKRLTIPSVSHLSNHVHINTVVYHPLVFRQRGHFYVFYTALLLDIENNSTHTHNMEKLLEQSPDVSDLVQ